MCLEFIEIPWKVSISERCHGLLMIRICVECEDVAFFVGMVGPGFVSGASFTRRRGGAELGDRLVGCTDIGPWGW